MDTTLTTPQKKRWTARWQDLPQGTHAQIAEALAEVKVRSRGKLRTKKVATWKVDLSHFFNGDAKALGRILDNEDVANIVARHVDLADAGELRAELAKAKGEAVDGPHDVRIPGFEDLGPVAASEVWLPPSINISGDVDRIGPRRNLEGVARACRPRGDAVALVVRGASGMGKTTLLKALHQELAKGHRVACNVGDSVKIVVLDDWHRMTRRERDEARDWLRPGRVLITSLPTSQRRLDLPGLTTVTLNPFESSWLVAYVAHLAKILKNRWSIQLEHSEVRAWLEDDPCATMTVANHRALGLVLRAVVEDRTPFADPVDGPRLIHHHWRTVLGHVEQIPEHLFVSVCGRMVLDGLAKAIVDRRDNRLPLETLTQLCAQAASAVGTGITLDGTGIFRPVQALLKHAPLHPDGNSVLVDALPLVLPAARGEWRDRLALLATTPMLHDVLLAAAMAEPDKVLQAMLDLEPAVLCDAMPGLTRLLQAPAPYKDARAWLRLFRMAAAWWTHGPKPPQARRGEPAVPASQSVNGHSPLLVLAQAAERHRGLMPEVLSPLTLGDLPNPLRQLLALYDIEEATQEELDATLRFVAPAHQPAFPVITDIRTARDWSHHVGPQIERNDWEIWWRTCAVAWWAEHPDGDRYIAGIPDGASPLPGAHQGDRGLDIWLGALTRRVKAGDRDAVATIVEAVRFALTHGGGRLQRRLAEELPRWNRLGTRLADRILAALEALEPIPFWEDQATWYKVEDQDKGSPFLEHLLRWVTGFGQELQRLVVAWGASDHFPWRCLMKAGLDSAAIADWVIAGTPEVSAEPMDLELLDLDSDVPPELLDERRRSAAEYLIEEKESAACIRLVTGRLPTELALRATAIVAQLRPDDLVEERIAAAVQAGMLAREPLIRNVELELPQEPAWRKVVESSLPGERVVRVCQWCAALTSEVRWRRLEEELDAFELHHGSDPEQVWLFQSTWGRALEHYLGQRDLPGIEDRHPIVHRLLGSELFAPAFNGWGSDSLWALAARILPDDDLRALLLANQQAPWGAKHRPTMLSGLVESGHLGLVLELLDDGDLGSSAAEALTKLRFQDTGWPLRTLERLLEERSLELDGVQEKLLVMAAQHDAAAAVAWLESHASEMSPSEESAWWAEVIPWIEPARARTRALRRYLELR